MNSALSQTADVVCLVDDDASIRRSITCMLKLDGVNVQAFSEAEEFLAYLGTNVAPRYPRSLDGTNDRPGTLSAPLREIAVDSCYFHYCPGG